MIAMKVRYDQYYQTENLFGDPYPELIEFFRQYPEKGAVLDLGCGQGRDAIPIARLGYQVTGVDHSKIGIQQMLQRALKEKLRLRGIVADINTYSDIPVFDFILLDNMFHFYKKDFERETNFIRKILHEVKEDGIVIFCIQDTVYKIKALEKILHGFQHLYRIKDRQFTHVYREGNTPTKYRLIAVKKKSI